MKLLVAALAATSLGACTSPSLLPRTSAMQSVALECGDGYLVNVDGTARNVLVIPYAVSEAAYAACARTARRPLSERVADAAIKHLRTTRQACRAGAVTSGGAGAYLVSYSDCRLMDPTERP